MPPMGTDMEGGELQQVVGHAGCGNGRGHGKGGHPMGRSNYSPSEVDHMLVAIREYHPISGI